MAAVARIAETVTAPSFSPRVTPAAEAKHAFCSAVLLKRQERCQYTGASRRAAGRAFGSSLKRSIERVAPAGYSWSHNWNRGSYGKERVIRAQSVATGTESVLSNNGAAAGAGEDVLTSAPIGADESSVNESSVNESSVNPCCGNGLPEKRQGTNAVHGGERRSTPFTTDALTTPIVQTATYTFKNTAQLIAFQEGTYDSYEYGRYGNPTTRVVEEKISALEGAEDTLVSSSGMNSATTMLLALVPDGGHIVTTTDCYRRTRQFIQTVLPRMGISTTVIDPSDMAGLERALVDHEVTLFFSESPTNPYLRCIDIELVSKMCHARGALVCIDGTFATPINQQAIALGADLVLASATKYLSGHQDVLAGSLSGRKAEIAKVRQLHNVLGGVVDASAAYYILRGMKTLDLRVQRQNQTALRLAEALENHPKISRVHYPGLASHPEHDIARRQMKGYGGVVSFEINGDLWRTAKFIDSLRLPYIAPSLGGVESLVEQPTIISYWDYGPDERARLGIRDNLVRFSCGIEDYNDIAEDMFRGLDSI